MSETDRIVLAAKLAMANNAIAALGAELHALGGALKSIDDEGERARLLTQWKALVFQLTDVVILADEVFAG